MASRPRRGRAWPCGLFIPNPCPGCNSARCVCDADQQPNKRRLEQADPEQSNKCLQTASADDQDEATKPTVKLMIAPDIGTGCVKGAFRVMDSERTSSVADIQDVHIQGRGRQAPAKFAQDANGVFYWGHELETAIKAGHIAAGAEVELIKLTMSKDRENATLRARTEAKLAAMSLTHSEAFTLYISHIKTEFEESVKTSLAGVYSQKVEFSSPCNDTDDCTDIWQGIDDVEVEWVFPVPQMWEEPSNQRMQDAAERAGMENVELVPEPQSQLVGSRFPTFKARPLVTSGNLGIAQAEVWDPDLPEHQDATILTGTSRIQAKPDRIKAYRDMFHPEKFWNVPARWTGLLPKGTQYIAGQRVKSEAWQQYYLTPDQKEILIPLLWTKKNIQDHMPVLAKGVDMYDSELELLEGIELLGLRKFEMPDLAAKGFTLRTGNGGKKYYQICFLIIMECHETRTSMSIELALPKSALYNDKGDFDPPENVDTEGVATHTIASQRHNPSTRTAPS
ncbi:hypothetical protein LTR56_010742 [Elasticomyces elasticus]|nr:hypothetical protein LTR56_010742 [Elasticomyces elasticus]KAK3667766.1 hypothetical protein LTR22_001211 [Elasticomyces elasticus]KAK4932240.1 hypothetical protein LTR49_001537 [Elasticomyces elasticus]KAK5745589.1 hypothetical protein LTS12_023071 [Elasticomyces elasticus]